MKPLLKTAAAIIVSLALLPSFALARDGARVSWSVNIGVPAPAVTVYPAPPVFPTYSSSYSPYSSAPPTYSASVYPVPVQVYTPPQPVYIEQPQIIEYRTIPYGVPYYVEETRYRNFHRRHWHPHSR